MTVAVTVAASIAKTKAPASRNILFIVLINDLIGEMPENKSR